MLYESKKQGGNLVDYGVVRNFTEVVDFLELRYVGYEGLNFIWINRKGDEAAIEKRLDRFLFTEVWFDLFPYVKIRNLYRDGSDYIFIYFDLRLVQGDEGGSGFKIFRFKVYWFYEENEGILLNRYGSRFKEVVVI